MTNDQVFILQNMFIDTDIGGMQFSGKITECPAQLKDHKWNKTARETVEKRTVNISSRYIHM